ncbi:hypothetical protein ACUSIJ_22325 [Pseudochelatococcus sp. B33]
MRWRIGPALARRSVQILIWSGLLLGATASGAVAQTASPVVNTPRDIGPALVACWNPPGGSDGLTATARFSFRRDGSLMGPPRITFSRLGENDARARAFLQSIADAFLDCTPLNFSPSFGSSVAGRIFTLRFIPSARRI